MTHSFLPAQIIKNKRNGMPNTKEEIKWFIDSYTKNELPDYQMSAWLMAVYFQGMNPIECLNLTNTMLHSGQVLSFPHIAQKKVDKHSTGGVGDKTSLILGPIVAACNVTVPMISGRGLGHTGGTLDKLESIPGFNTQLNLYEFTKMLEDFAIGFIGQTAEICPADKKIYALRDVTATVESLPLICASIMSKKLAEGIDGLVLDVKYGSGAFMKSLEDAEKLAISLKQIGEGAGKRVVALLTNMNQPLGAFVGNSLEIHECLEILQNKQNINADGVDMYSDCRELSLELASYMIWIANLGSTIEQARVLAKEALTSGKAYKKFLEVCRAQGGVVEDLPVAAHHLNINAQQDGYIKSFDTEKMGISAIQLGAGRKNIIDKINPSSGFRLHKKMGHRVKKGDLLFTIYGDSLNLLRNQESSLYDCIEWSNTSVEKQALITKVLL